LLLRREYETARTLAPVIEEASKLGGFAIDSHRQLQFTFKYAAIDFALGQWEDSLTHVNTILDTRGGILRDDLLINTRLLELICHYELSNFLLLDHFLTNFARLLRRSTETAEVHRRTATLLRSLLRDEGPAAKQREFADYFSELQELSADPFEQKALRYLDLRSWYGRS
ncbi:MAG: hypothetical protein WBA17_14785, partial [Saprospiraceae bacterium]